ncbi:MAG TPA: GNAT family N-acyltransferase [Burkholderiales bacterium]|nr:GNAT family N-acyltransferase [Burkholderiales bacterium]
MTLSGQLARQFNDERIEDARHGLHVGLATTLEDVRAAQRLRYRVFVEEMGARLDCVESGIESDRFDPYCHHLLVRTTDSHKVVGCYRLLTDTQARAAGGYYSETEFDLTRVTAMPGRFIEAGRACVEPAYRSGAVITLLWSGIARFIVMNRIDYLIGCASIPLTTGTREASMIYERLAANYLAGPEWRVFPKVPLPQIQLTGADESVTIPPLLKAYLRVGARLGGAPAWDPDFNVADLFIMLRTEDIAGRYSRHFLQRM